MKQYEDTPTCPDCVRSVQLSADGTNHIYGEGVGDVRPCRMAANSSELPMIRSWAQVMANILNLAFVIYKSQSGGETLYKARRSDFKMPLDLLPHIKEVERIAPTTLERAPLGEESGEIVIDAPHEPFLLTSLDNSDKFEARCKCGKWAFDAELKGDTTGKEMRELLGRALASFQGHVKVNLRIVSVEVSRETLKERHKLFMRLQPDLFADCSCGKWAFDDPRLFNTARAAREAIEESHKRHVEEHEKEPDPFETPANVEARPRCVAPASREDESNAKSGFRVCAECGGALCFPHSASAPEDHECQGIAQKLALDLEYAEETTPPAHALKIEWLEGAGAPVEFERATFGEATCSCGEFKTSRLLDFKTDAAAYVEGMTTEFHAHLGEAHGEGSGVEVLSKKEQIIKLYEDGVTDIAQLVRKVAARPSYVAQVLQASGLITGYFDLYTTTARENNVYARFFRNVLSFKSVAASKESVKRIDRLFNYFERLGDRAGQHQAMVLALTGKNRARWSGKHEESEVFSEWLNSH
jgi:hypothetical protein